MDKDLIKIILWLVEITTLVLWGNNYLMMTQCRNNITEMGRNYRYDIVNGCRVQQKDGTYIYWDMYKSVNQ